MFVDEDLADYLKTNNTLKIESLVLAEWNLNDLENISMYGNYRYRPTSTASSIYFNLPNSYDKNDIGNYYLNALESKINSEIVLDDNDLPIVFETPEINRSLYYSLKDCFGAFRPRSGINKPLFLNTEKYIDNIKSARRPRYYMASSDDAFKYWNSFRIEEGTERGISNRSDVNGIGYYIDDACPFVVYKQSVASNRIVVKMQTNMAETASSNIKNSAGNIIQDPFGFINKSNIPKRWAIEYLDGDNNWVTALSFNEDSVRKFVTPIVPWDGYVEIFYGLLIPNEYKEAFHLIDKLTTINNRPVSGLNGESYLIGATTSSAGQIHTWDSNDEEWKIFDAEYGFQLLDDYDNKKLGTISKLTDPEYFISGGKTIYRDIVFLKGLRLKIETLYSPDNTFDLIELSPRLVANISDYVVGFEVNKTIPNDTTGLPVGGLLASTGSMTIMNHDFAFSEQNIFSNNQGSIIYNLLNPKTRVDLYQIVKNVNDYDKYVPLKSMYIDEFPKNGGTLLDIELSLRDGFFRFESQNAPSIFLQNTSLTYAIAVLLDNIGFSNYVFKNLNNIDPVIPYFFVEPDVSVADVLQRLAIATQSSMFFDEYNNFVVMSKEYMLPEQGQRNTDITLYGNQVDDNLPNVIELIQNNTRVVNDGRINYITRYIQRSPVSLQQAQYIDEDRYYGYQPVVLWEAPSQTSYKSINEKAKSNNFTLSAVTLNRSLSASIPYVENRQILNNTIDIGESVYWLARPQGYLYANGEVIKYDAIEYTIPIIGNVWINDELDYQNYFSNLPFNGKMYPTGLIRIYSEPYYEVIKDNLGQDVTVYKNGSMRKTGRGQFGTKVVEHEAGINSFWTDNENVEGYAMNANYLFTTTPTASIARPPASNIIGATQFATWKNTRSLESTRNGIIVNFLRESIPSDDIVKELKTTSKGTVQSSALVFSGPKINIDKNQISYVRKNLDSDYKHFGTRMRIIGRKESNSRIQTPANATEYYVVSSQTGGQDATLSGGSGGIAIMIPPSTSGTTTSENPTWRGGYYFEICSLTADNLESYNTTDIATGETKSVLHNILFYKVIPGYEGGKEVAVPYKLWGGLSKILVDEGRFVGQDRISQEENPTVYDLAIEYKEIGSTLRFYLYLNGNQIATVDDANPINNRYNNMALFVRGASKCMFENVYALKNQYSQESKSTVVELEKDTFGTKEINSSEALKKYALSGFVQASHLSGISSQTSNKYNIYYEEFGTIFRECYYFNVKYDKAYPAFRAILKPTFNREKTYTSSGFYSDSYGAEFLVFNATDKMIVLDETSGNHLQIIGITFTQSTSNTLTVDEFYKTKSDFSDPIVINNVITSPEKSEAEYQDIKTSRSKYGRNEFTLESIYIQSSDQANNLMNWIVSKLKYPRIVLTAEVFGVPHLQLGDIATINYTNPNNDLYVDPTKQFIVYNIDYGYSNNGPSSVVRMVEV